MCAKDASDKGGCDGYLLRYLSFTDKEYAAFILWPDREPDNGNEYLINIAGPGQDMSVVIVGDWEMNALAGLSSYALFALAQNSGKFYRFDDRDTYVAALILSQQGEDSWRFRIETQQASWFLNHSAGETWPASNKGIVLSTKALMTLLSALSHFGPGKASSKAAFLAPRINVAGNAGREWLRRKQHNAITVFSELENIEGLQRTVQDVEHSSVGDLDNYDGKIYAGANWKNNE